jgi:hypothetical protein
MSDLLPVCGQRRNYFRRRRHALRYIAQIANRDTDHTDHRLSKHWTRLAHSALMNILHARLMKIWVWIRYGSA